MFGDFMIKNKNKNKKFGGFSLAETLITLLIVTILVLASVPVITKKKITPSEPHGKWMCTLNADGKHVVWETGDENMNNANLWKLAGKKTENGTNDGSYCEFKIPKNARNFAVTAAGGGGGGAGAEKTYFLRSGSQTIPIDEKMYGTYKMLAIASGGSGGISQCNVDELLSNAANTWHAKFLFGAGGGGGAGGVGYAEYVIGKGTKALVLSQGSGVYITVKGDGASDGVYGNNSTIERIYENSNGIDTSEKIIHAIGGEGGDGLWHICSIHAKDGYGRGGVNGSVSFEGKGEYKSKSTLNAPKSKDLCSGYRYVGPDENERNNSCYAYRYEYEIDDINDFFGSAVINTDIETQPGRGGNPGSSKDKECSKIGVYCDYNSWIRSDQSRITRSTDGIVVVATNNVILGGGGGAAVGISNSLKTDFGNVLSLKITIGKGGAGGKAGEYDTATQTLTSHATNGSAGTKTVIGNNIFVLNGGSGGKAGKTDNQTAGWTSIAGKDGEQAPINNSKVLVQTGLDQAKRELYQKGWGGMAHLDQYAEGAEVGPDGNTSVFYGAGGGGGGVGEDGSLGNGGAGSPGFVMIEW